MIYIIFIIAGFIVAFLKICYEFNDYAKVKDEVLFHSVGLSIVIIILGIVFCFETWQIVAVMALSYWNCFEILGNILHGQYWLYVGQEAGFDKFIRKHFNCQQAKLALHIISFSLIILIIFL